MEMPVLLVQRHWYNEYWGSQTGSAKRSDLGHRGKTEEAGGRDPTLGKGRCWIGTGYWISKTQTRLGSQGGERLLSRVPPRCCSLCQIVVWARRPEWSITRRKWLLALILISAGLEQISFHLSPYLSLSWTTTPSQSGYLEAAASVETRHMLCAEGQAV